MGNPPVPSPSRSGNNASDGEIDGGKCMDDWELPGHPDREAGMIDQNPCGIIPIHLQRTAIGER
jgi:hypothetical protein